MELISQGSEGWMHENDQERFPKRERHVVEVSHPSIATIAKGKNKKEKSIIYLNSSEQHSRRRLHLWEISRT